MRFTRERPKRDMETMLPLINLVFLLLIFFLIVGQISASDPFPVDPAQSTSKAPAGASEIVIVIGADGQMAFNGTMVDDGTLGPMIREWMSEEENNQSTPNVRLKADAGALATRIVAIMEILRDVGVQSVQLLTTPTRS